MLMICLHMCVWCVSLQAVAGAQWARFFNQDKLLRCMWEAEREVADNGSVSGGWVEGWEQVLEPLKKHSEVAKKVRGDSAATKPAAAATAASSPAEAAAEAAGGKEAAAGLGKAGGGKTEGGANTEGAAGRDTAGGTAASPEGMVGRAPAPQGGANAEPPAGVGAGPRASKEEGAPVTPSVAGVPGPPT